MSQLESAVAMGHHCTPGRDPRLPSCNRLASRDPQLAVPGLNPN
jgi:hypothetical protein